MSVFGCSDIQLSNQVQCGVAVLAGSLGVRKATAKISEHYHAWFRPVHRWVTLGDRILRDARVPCVPRVCHVCWIMARVQVAYRYLPCIPLQCIRL